MIVKSGKGLKHTKKMTTSLPKFLIWVLVPYLETDDPKLKHYYDFAQNKKEFKKAFEELDADWEWQPVTMQNFQEIIASIRKKSKGKKPLVINLCDGDEINGAPGVSVIRELRKHKLIYTGSEIRFYDITTSKIPMKKAFDRSGVLHANWEILNGNEKAMLGICERIGSPIIIKPAVSGGSMGVSLKNVVHTDEEVFQRIKELKNGYHGWNLIADGLIAEQFIKGPEFTTLIVGSYQNPDKCIVYPPVERVFHSSLPEEEKFLSFDRLWDIYEEESPMPDDCDFYDYYKPDETLVPAIKKISLDAFLAVKGTGYARIDIRMDAATKKFYMLEVNAQCGLSEDEAYTSIGAILRFANKSFGQLIQEIIDDAFQRRGLMP
jgi:D-alanine-D-alanine ligase